MYGEEDAEERGHAPNLEGVVTPKLGRGRGAELGWGSIEEAWLFSTLETKTLTWMEGSSVCTGEKSKVQPCTRKQPMCMLT